VASPPNNIGYVVAGYSVTAALLGAYSGALYRRARRATHRASAVAARRRPPR
jgi:hypothetical protein